MNSLFSKSSLYHYHFNSDLSGTITVTKTGTADFIIELPAQDFINIVAQWVSSQKISRIEQMTAKEVLLSS